MEEICYQHHPRRRGIPGSFEGDGFVYQVWFSQKVFWWVEVDFLSIMTRISWRDLMVRTESLGWMDDFSRSFVDHGILGRRMHSSQTKGTTKLTKKYIFIYCSCIYLFIYFCVLTTVMILMPLLPGLGSR